MVIPTITRIVKGIDQKIDMLKNMVKIIKKDILVLVEVEAEKTLSKEEITTTNMVAKVKKKIKE